MPCFVGSTPFAHSVRPFSPGAGSGSEENFPGHRAPWISCVFFRASPDFPDRVETGVRVITFFPPRSGSLFTAVPGFAPARTGCLRVSPAVAAHRHASHQRFPQEMHRISSRRPQGLLVVFFIQPHLRSQSWNSVVVPCSRRPSPSVSSVASGWPPAPAAPPAAEPLPPVVQGQRRRESWR